LQSGACLGNEAFQASDTFFGHSKAWGVQQGQRCISRVAAYVYEYYRHGVHNDEDTCTPEQISVDVGRREHSIVECKERRFDKCKRERVDHLVRVPMLQVGNVGELRFVQIAYGMSSDACVSLKMKRVSPDRLTLRRSLCEIRSSLPG
jgi:hypothetical protein